ncbi:hypothetical protein CANARDRAFT_21668 [[Candida] arabinofermentans NRRL YB-2248]|uniref:PI31 proteasome regulator C-terminal domain-containing protein n=1 Tax=[Candida] arabinofermentans NRRL YB-2248 TaxID=983967 RepID=A0A1E4T4I6_9ASCO|nr:hypothetical protein CANARDRAFT_21668 [[Candida] arabinofermentans NRRL YB-2248]
MTSTISSYAQLVAYIFLDFINNQGYTLDDSTDLTKPHGPVLIKLKAGHSVHVSEVDNIPTELQFDLSKNGGRVKWSYIMTVDPNEQFEFPVEFNNLEKSQLKDVYMTMGYNFDNFFDDLKNSVNYLEFAATTEMKLDFKNLSQKKLNETGEEEDVKPPNPQKSLQEGNELSKGDTKQDTKQEESIQSRSITKPVPENLAAPKFDDELEIQSGPSTTITQPRNEQQQQLGNNDLYPGGIKDPTLKPSLDPLGSGVGGFGYGGMHPTANDPLFQGLGSGGSRPQSGIRYDNPLLGPDDDLGLIGSGLGGGMGLGNGRNIGFPGNGNGNRGGPGFGSGFGSGSGFPGGNGGFPGGF